nr:DNA replication protein [Guarani virophage]
MSKTQKTTVKAKKAKRIPVIELVEAISSKNLKRLLSAEGLDEVTRIQLSLYYRKIFKTTSNPLNNDEVGFIKVKYFHSDKLEDTGRVYAEKGRSLQSFKKAIRAFINNGINLDIDMKNSHPTLITQYCKKNKILCPFLDDYVRRREKRLEDVMVFHKISRDQAKELILRLCYLGSYKIPNDDGTSYKPKKTLEFLEKFKEEAEIIADRIAKKEKELYAKIKDNDDCKNKKAVILSVLAQQLEHSCLMEMYNFFTSKKIRVSTLCFDGMLINGINGNISDLLRECENFVYEQINYKINLEEKPMEHKLKFEVPIFSDYVDSDSDCQIKLFELVGKNKFKFCNGVLWVFDDQTGMFENSNHVVFRYLKRYKEYFNFIISTDDDGNHKTKNYATDEVLRKKIIGFIKDECQDNEWMLKTQTSSLGYLLFKDGIYNFNTSTFTEGFDPNIVFKFRVPWKFPKYDKELIKKAYKLSFGALFDNPKPFITSLACALAGEIKLKKIYFCPGKPNAGKSYLIKMLQYCFGDYIGTINGENISYNSKDSRDEAAKYRWAYLLANTRIVMSSEISMKKSIDGNMIKKFASAGDKIVGRKHCESEISFTPNFTIFCMFNDIPEIEPHDEAVSNRLVYHEFPYVFVKEEELNEKPYNKLKDNDLDSKFETKDFASGFIHILLDAYKNYLENGLPEFDNEVKEKWTAQTKQIDKITSIINEYYEVTNNVKDFVPLNEILKFKEQHKDLKTISKNRFNEILVEELKLKEGRSAKLRYWSGLKKRHFGDDINFE